MFRLRFIDNTIFPMNLLSVDIRCPLEITYRAQQFRCMHDIAALDVVFIENGTKDFKSQVLFISRAIYVICMTTLI